MSKISVLLRQDEDARFTAYCQERGFKKSTLIARLVRDHLDREGFSSTSVAAGGRNANSTSKGKAS